jgi:hypothetical protein
MSDETKFTVIKVTEGSMAEAHAATVRPEGSIHGRDMYQTPNMTDRESESKSLPHKNG